MCEKSARSFKSLNYQNVSPFVGDVWQFRTTSRLVCDSNPPPSGWDPKDGGGDRVLNRIIGLLGKLKSFDWSVSGTSRSGTSCLHPYPRSGGPPLLCGAPPSGVSTSRGRAETKKWAAWSTWPSLSDNWLVFDGTASIYTNRGCTLLQLLLLWNNGISHGSDYKPLIHKRTSSILLCHIFKG